MHHFIWNVRFFWNILSIIVPKNKVLLLTTPDSFRCKAGGTGLWHNFNQKLEQYVPKRW